MSDAHKKLVIFYSLTGHTRRLAHTYAEENQADVYEVVYKKQLNVVAAFSQCPAARKQRPAKNLEPITADFAAYSEVIIMAPIWAGFPAPPVNNIIEALPHGTQVRFRLFSAGTGVADKEKVVRRVTDCGSTVVAFDDFVARKSK